MKDGFSGVMACTLFLAVNTFAFAEQLSCQLAKRYKDGGSVSYSANITLGAGKITALYVNSTIASGAEGGGYLCAFNTSKLNKTAKWSEQGALTTLMVNDDGEESVVSIRKVGGAYVIDPSGINRYYCGFGAEWPDEIIVTSGSKKCKVSPSP